MVHSLRVLAGVTSFGLAIWSDLLTRFGVAPQARGDSELSIVWRISGRVAFTRQIVARNAEFDPVLQSGSCWNSPPSDRLDAVTWWQPPPSYPDPSAGLGPLQSAFPASDFDTPSIIWISRLWNGTPDAACGLSARDTCALGGPPFPWHLATARWTLMSGGHQRDCP